MDTADNKGWIEIARAGRFQDAAGTYHDFTQSRLEKIVTGYDPKRGQAPLVIGHPALNGPAHGWVEALKINNNKLLAKPAYVTAEIKRAVDNGLYKYVSMSLYKDDRLRHVGILGGHPPAIDGLAPISFAGEAALTIDFSEAPEPEPDEPQPKGSQMTVDELTRQLTELQTKLVAVTQEKETAVKEAAALKEELAKIKGEAEKTTAEFAAFRDKQSRELLTGRIDQLVKDGKVPPSEKEAVAKTAEALRQSGALNFADGSDNPLETYLGSLEGRQPSDIFHNFSAPAADDGGAVSSKPLSAKLLEANMPLDGQIGCLSTNAVQIVAAGHPAVILTGAVKTGTVQWLPGTILIRDAGELTPWDGTTGDPVGVLTEACDSTVQGSANYLAHGLAVIENLKLADGSAPTATNIYALHKIGVYGA